MARTQVASDDMCARGRVFLYTRWASKPEIISELAITMITIENYKV
jgi:hypothetical protein